MATANGGMTFSGSNTAASGIAHGFVLNNTLVAAANNDILSGVYINPVFTNGAFSGVTNFALNVSDVTNTYGLSTKAKRWLLVRHYQDRFTMSLLAAQGKH